MKSKLVTLDFGKHKVTWRKGYYPVCTCLCYKILSNCIHVMYIANQRITGDSKFLFKSEGGEL